MANAVGRTPLHIAATVGRCDIGAHLLRKQANPSVQDSIGWTPRQTAEFHRHSDFCDLMIRAESIDLQYSMKDVPPGTWDTPLWHECISSYHEKKKQFDKESRRFDKKIRRVSSIALIPAALRRSGTVDDEESSVTSAAGNDSVVSDSFDALSRKKKAKEGLSSLAMAARRNVELK